MRRAIVGLTALVLVGACTAAPTADEAAEQQMEDEVLREAVEPTEPSDEDADAVADEGPEVGDAARDPDPAHTTDDAPPQRPATARADDVATPAVLVDDHAGVGAMGPALLRADVAELVVEVLAQDGASPDGRALDHLQRVITREVDKPDGVHRLQHVFTSDRRTWSAEELRALAAERRHHRSDADRAAILVMYVRGSFEDEGAIGVALNATEIAVFPDRWRDLVGGVLGAASNVERAVLVHELGHLFGLVELTYDSIHDRHDDQRPGHSRNRSSVMYWAIATTAVGQVFDGPPPNDFDRADRDDLRYLRTGSW